MRTLPRSRACIPRRLLPGVEKIARAAADPELRDVAAAAMGVLSRVAQEGEEAAQQPDAFKADPAVSGRAQRRRASVAWIFCLPAHASLCLLCLFSLPVSPLNPLPPPFPALVAPLSLALEQVSLQMLKDIIARSLDVKVDTTTLAYVADMTTLLLNARNLEFDEWADAMVPYLSAFLSEEGAEGVCRTYMAK